MVFSPNDSLFLVSVQKEGGTQLKLIIDYPNDIHALFKPMRWVWFITYNQSATTPSVRPVDSCTYELIGVFPHNLYSGIARVNYTV